MVKKPRISMEWSQWRLKTGKTGPLRILMATRLRRYRFAREPFNERAKSMRLLPRTREKRRALGLSSVHRDRRVLEGAGSKVRSKRHSRVFCLRHSSSRAVAIFAQNDK